MQQGFFGASSKGPFFKNLHLVTHFFLQPFQQTRSYLFFKKWNEALHQIGASNKTFLSSVYSYHHHEPISSNSPQLIPSPPYHSSSNIFNSKKYYTTLASRPPPDSTHRSIMKHAGRGKEIPLHYFPLLTGERNHI